MTIVHDEALDDVGTSESDSHAEGRARGTRRRGVVDSERATRSRAAQRAIDRRRRRVERDQRAGRSGSVPSSATRSATGRRTPVSTESLRRIPFVVPVIALLVVGLGLSLWLSTRSAQDSYRLGMEREQNQALMDRRDALKRTFESGDSAPELSDKAARLGLIPAQNPARMIVEGDGRSRMVGEPQPAAGQPVGTINPAQQEDPAAQIDPSEVDDSQGLGEQAAGAGPRDDSPAPAGDEGAAPADDANPDAPSGEPDATPDAGPGAGTAPIPPANVTPREGDRDTDGPGSQSPDAQSGAQPSGSTAQDTPPPPNVLPPTGNPPSPNSAQPR